MKKNRILYLLFLTGMLFFFIFYNGWFSFFCLIITLCLPLFSFLVSLPFFRMIRLKLSSESILYVQDPLDIRISLTRKNKALFSGLRFHLVLEDVLSGTVNKRDLELSGKTEQIITEDNLNCGTYKIRAERCRVLDILSLIAVPVPSSNELTVKVFPVNTTPSPVPDLNSVRPVQYVPAKNQGFSEITDIRGYRPGDPLRSVHWKLTAKTDDILVKEPQENVIKKIYLILRSGPDRDLLDRSFGEFLWYSDNLLKMQVPFTLIYSTDRVVLQKLIENREDIDYCVERFLLLKLPEDDSFSPDIPTDADRTFMIPGKEVL